MFRLFWKGVYSKRKDFDPFSDATIVQENRQEVIKVSSLVKMVED